jgi:energy-converting hydrogenase Eha subunit B
MKTNTRFLNTLIFAFIMVFIVTSCEEDDLDGLFGDPVSKFLGTWKCEETGDLNGYFGPFNVEIVINPDNSTEVLIKNFNYQGMDVKARAIVAGNTITIPRQKICDDTIEIRGSGSFSGNEFSITYKTNDGADEENITARFFK